MLHETIGPELGHREPEWEGRQILRDLDGRPHLLLRLRLVWGYFPRRDGIPFVRVGRARARWIEIAEDEESVRAYFDRVPADGAPIEFGYGRTVRFTLRRRFRRDDVSELDPRLIPPGTGNLDRFSPALDDPVFRPCGVLAS
jgi:hypothetical protein